MQMTLFAKWCRRSCYYFKMKLCICAEQIRALIERQESLYERKSELSAILEACKESGNEANNAASSAAENWSGEFEWDSEADDVRLNVFGISSYRANQREIINAIMSGRDVLVIMAAGGGKSLCYQLPAVLRDGIALVVSPLLSLIQDQVMGLTALGIPAYMLTSTNKGDEKFIYKTLEKGEGELKILYVTPEKISKSKRFMSKLEKCHHAGRLSLISIDEAHCCSQWGHDFRPDYKSLSILKTQFPRVPIVALTATATQRVQNDLIEMLHIPRCVKFVSTVNRPNLFYMVKEKSSVGKVVIDEIAEFIQESYPNNESGIVYCFSRKECEQVAKELRERGISADYYHADMDVNAREKVHMRWSNNKLQVIVGTVAFGMGINKPDVRFVIHHSLSKSMETYYQESGRAGRDGLPSECLLYFRPGDAPRQSSMVFYENSGLQNLYDIVRYCLSKRQCRRSAFFHHFAEPLQECNGMCDICAFSSEVKEVDVSGHAKLMVSLLQDMQANDQRSTMLQLVDKMKIKQKELGSELKREEIEQLILHLLLARFLKEEFQHTPYATNAYIAVGSLAKQILQGKKSVKLEIYTEQRTKDGVRSAKQCLGSSGLELKLDELRKELSSAHGGILPHSVLSTEQIIQLASQKPNSLEQLEKLIGKLRTEKYGNRILKQIEKYYDFEPTDKQEIDARAAKRLKSKKNLVIIE
ncbi:Mediator of RNA polymerase II transcription subunit 34 isoform B [Glycine soja]|uniref:ATP-dependent DNA helicase n=1 Tax=Glycine soja TaxID=3848 RepID=A0A445J4J2_GLYSO|nr:Mediator of RNA polymerase II transcription subunit 34 isoform B [Glycine soja]